MRFFYNSSFAAAFMAENFNIGIALRDDCAPEKLVCNEDGTIADYKRELIDSSGPWNDSTLFYIHPDSLKLLAPQVGDLVRWHHESEYAKTGDKITLLKHPDEAKFDRGNVLDEIIQRDGLAFIWPQNEKLTKEGV